MLLFLLSLLFCLVTKGYPSGSPPSGVQELWVDEGTNHTIPCPGPWRDTMWIFEGTRTKRIQGDGKIVFQSVKKGDEGIYTCKAESEDGVRIRFKLRVRTPPSPPRNVRAVEVSTFHAHITWEMENEPEPLTGFQLAYRLKNETEKDWKACCPGMIVNTTRQYWIDHLARNSTYLVKIWGRNRLGSGLPSLIELRTLNDPEEIELEKHFLAGADNFDVRIWILAVGIVGVTLLVLVSGVVILFCKEYGKGSLPLPSGESIELLPNIILNPGFEPLPLPDENSNSARPPFTLNNNSVIHPSRV